MRAEPLQGGGLGRAPRRATQACAHGRAAWGEVQCPAAEQRRVVLETLSPHLGGALGSLAAGRGPPAPPATRVAAAPWAGRLGEAGGKRAGRAGAEPPCELVATPGEIGERPSVMTADMPSRGIALRASDVCL
jgi:hypothetical protein